LSRSPEGRAPLSISACTTWHQTFADDLRLYRDAGVEGIGLWEFKLPRGQDEDSAARLRESGLRATFCFPEVPSIIPGDTLFSQPRDRVERLEHLCDGIRRLARFDPLRVICYAGPPGNDVRQMRAWVVEMLREASLAATESKVRLAIEVLRPSRNGSLVSTVSQALELIADADADNVDVLIDTWHFWDAPRALEDVARNADRIVGVQLADRRSSARGMMDRTLPGWGDVDLRAIVRALKKTTFNGWYEIEIFSDDGTFGSDYPDSLWKMDAKRLVAEARRSYDELWDATEAGA
jgi:sugar phosphate isomerase/epimerase